MDIEISEQVPSTADVEAIYATYTPDRLLFVRSDVAVVNVNQRYVRRDGSTTELAVENGSPVYFLAKDDGEWRIAAAQNAVLVPQS